MKLLELLKQKGWSQGELSRRSGVDRHFLNHIAHERKSPSVRTLVKLADALGCSVDAVMGRSAVEWGKGLAGATVDELLAELGRRAA